MGTQQTFAGWKNRSTFELNKYLHADEGGTDYWYERAREYLSESVEEAPFKLANAIRNYILELIPSIKKPYSGFLLGAIDTVEFGAIAKNLIDRLPIYDKHRGLL